MKATLFVYIGLLTLTIGMPISFAQEEEMTTTQSYRFRPCSSWSYDFNAHAYVCSFTDSYIDVPATRELESLQSVVAQLTTKVQELEQRVQKLESGR